MTAVAAKRDEVTAVGLRSPDPRRRAICPCCHKPKPIGPKRCAACFGVRVVPDAPVHSTIAYDQDAGAEAFVETNVGGATLREVGEALGITRERVRQIETVALRKLREAMQDAGVSARDLAEVLAARVSPGEHIESGRFIPDHERSAARTATTRAEREAALDEPSEWLRALNEQLDDAHAIGLLACHAANLAEFGQ